MTIDITPIIEAGDHFVEVVIDGDKLKRRGPFASADEAEAEASRVAAICRAMRANVHRGTAAVACER